jgi:hypothetical protein
MNKRIDALPSADAITGVEIVPIMQSGITKQIAVSDLRPYKVYSALLTQIGLDAPTAVVLENTLGEIVWTFDANGSYFATLIGAFVENKTFFLITPNSDVIDNSIFTIQYNNSDFFVVNTGDGTSYLNGLLVNTSIEIRVYN